MTGGNTSLFLNVSVSAPPGKYNVTIAGIANGKIQSVNLTVSILQVETTTTETTLSETSESQFSFLRSLFPKIHYFYIIIGVILTGSAVSTFMILNMRRRRKEVDLSYMSAARAIAKLEELKALGKIDTETYERLKKEYEAKI